MAEAERQWPVRITLRHPFDFGSERVTSLEFRRGRLGDLKGMKLGETFATEQLVQVASKLCGQPIALIEMLDVDDAGEVMELAMDFFAKCLAGGKKHSG